MKYSRTLPLILAVFLLASLGAAALGQANDKALAIIGAAGSVVRWDVLAPSAGGNLTVTAPDGRSFTKDFRGGSVEFSLTDKGGLPDGSYQYELRLRPNLSAAQKEALKAARGNDDDSESERAARKRPALPNMIQSGSFAVVNGQVIVAGLSEGTRAADNTQPATAPAKSAPAAPGSGNTAARLRNHRFSLLASSGPKPDIVHADDVIIQGSLCVGLDCVVNESFGFDTIRLKENNTRIKFDDTSTATGFPNNDWQLTANDSASGGANKFSIEDVTGSKVPFTITAGAPTNSVFVDSAGRLGLRTSTPVLDIHALTGNTPAIRLEQNNTGGFTAQTWDIAGNEANFFVRDVTGGSRLPFRIRPGAPTSSIDISASGNVGIGTASPATKMDILSGDNFGSTNIFRVRSLDTTEGVALGFEDIRQTGINSILHLNANGSGKLFIGDVSTGGVAMVTAGGNVGIGTAAPDQKLSVNGDADKVGGGSWLNFSDERLKTIKGSYKSGLSAVMQLNPIRYEYLKNNALGLKSDGEHIGFGAQSLQKIIPEAVVQNSDGYLMVNNDPIIWTMLNAIKEQQKEIEQLKGQIQKLQRTSHRRR